MRLTITPSIMAKNQRELDASLTKLKNVIKTVHLDIVDGKFAKNKVMTFPFRLKKEFQYIAHLMVKNPEKWIEKNGKKVDIYIPHIEEIKNIGEYITKTRKLKRKVAFALLPETKVKQIASYLKKIDYVLILTVHPGFYGSRYLPSNLRKVKIIKKINPKTKVIVDGGMNPKRVKKAVTKGVDIIVSGNYVMGSDNVKERLIKLREKI
ncbi:hypothetical protein HOL21_00855 [Candidatus Woesearchaeota archaeon]|jgi:ribulose-phosphate 3-epimerase|nr:hypothetical protein [Candidatus Woesearchaeota archaeon]MBT5396744.1 hypothetical protein [Candidatus Woesearchaeota archaeon]MBT5924704.1 hypothetical protein [Candidatus Woesearchaeota archaeon]MBT6367632.1 hypothetical protein [Candidatus Woesearchaeota archaeon]MBT7762968.1 hypothetical protein [Candidatus Woesearchaeota archaeon]